MKLENIHSNYINSPLVEIPTDSGIVIEMQYYLKKMPFSIDKCLLRKEVLDKLFQAKQYLPSGITFKIWDAYRPIELQKEIYYQYKDEIIKNFKLENISEDQQNKIISKYVSYPNYDVKNAPLHTTGGAVDLTLVDIKTGKELDMGCYFDEFSDRASTDYYEKNNLNNEAKKNRRILYNAMIRAGFTNLPNEFWHYDYGDNLWSFYTKKLFYMGE